MSRDQVAVATLESNSTPVKQTQGVLSVVSANTGAVLCNANADITHLPHHTDLHITDKIDAAEPPSSEPPSPPSTGSSTPRITIGPCPSRLQPLIPPFNYGTVDVHTIYRSSFPQDRNLDFLQTLKIRSILTLVDTAPSPAVQAWITTNNITHTKVHLATNKHGAVNVCPDTLSEALLFIMNRANHPLHIHCNQGKHRTGCVVACLRKIEGVALPEILAEYHAYAWPKAREGDVKLITDFDPASVYEYAVRTGYLRDIAKLSVGPGLRAERLGDMDALAAALMHGIVRNDSAVDVEMSAAWPTCGQAGDMEMEEMFGEATQLDEMFGVEMEVDGQVGAVTAGPDGSRARIVV